VEKEKSMRSESLFAVAIFALVTLSFVSLPSTPPAVTISSGRLEGTHFGDSPNDVAFLGVPYATPPVGELRWRPPEPLAKWDGARKATAFGPVCPQRPQGWLPYIEGQEDCLYLNIWTGRLSRDAKLPVIVYFHGGSNTAGYSQFLPLGPALSRLGVVVVSANYRLGPFGFLAHPALTAESKHHSSGNYGLLDQLQALRWVRENISEFGGDPGHVTVMGQSAGAVDVCLLMASPLAKDLFQGAILQSGECQSTWNEDIRQPIAYNQIEDTGEAIGERLANDLRIPANDPNALSKLRSLSTKAVMEAWKQDPKVHFDAIVDGWVVAEQPARIFAEHQQRKVPILIGSNADEATVFGDGGVKTVEEYKKYLRQDTGRFWEQEFAAYPAASENEVASRRLQLQNDSFAYGAYSMALAMAGSGQPAYLYDFTFGETGKRAHLGAYHGIELYFLSDTYPQEWEHSEEERRLSGLIRGYWTQFAKAGNPNQSGSPAWPELDAGTEEILELGRGVRVRTIDPRLHALQKLMVEVLSDSAVAARK
jgi:para-nitrobenzyl esterase